MSNFNGLRLHKVDFCDGIIIITQTVSTLSYEISIVTAVRWSTFGIKLKVCGLFGLLWGSEHQTSCLPQKAVLK